MKNNSSLDMLHAMQQKNLVYNANFLYFSNREKDITSPTDYKHPDGWVYEGVTNGIGFNMDTNMCLVKTGSGKTVLSQALHEFPRWKETLKGQLITAKAHVELKETMTVSLTLTDGIETRTFSGKEKGAFDLEVQFVVNESPEKLVLSITSEDENQEIQLSSVYANIGNIALATNSCIVNGVIGERKQYVSTEIAPAEELSLCQPAEELAANYTRLNSVLNQRFGKGQNDRSILPDMRGYFSRSWNNDSNVDPDASNRTNWGASGNVTGDKVGTLQSDQFKKHDHAMNTSDTYFVKSSRDKGIYGHTSGMTNKTGKTGGDETRPKNISELYTIKWA